MKLFIRETVLKFRPRIIPVEFEKVRYTGKGFPSEFLDTGASDPFIVVEGSHLSKIAFGNVLLATSGGLNHLVNSAVATLEIVLGKVVGDVVNHLGDLIDTEVAVVAVLGEEGVGGILSTLNFRSILSTRIIRIILTILIILIHSSVFFISSSTAYPLPY